MFVVHYSSYAIKIALLIPGHVPNPGRLKGQSEAQNGRKDRKGGSILSA